MSAHGDEILLQRVQNALLRAGDARENPRGNALQRAAHAAPRPRHGAAAHVHRVAGEAVGQVSSNKARLLQYGGLQREGFIMHGQ